MKPTGKVEMSRVAPDYWRQMDIFDGKKFPHTVHIFGVGATGSYLAETFGKMGVKDMVVYDFDTVDTHNIPNQLYGISDFKKPKVEALQARLVDTCGIEVVPVNAKVKGFKDLSKFRGIAFLGVDTMKSRKAIWERAIKPNPGIELLIETRMGAEFGKIYAFNPGNKAHAEKWEATLFDDAEGDEAVCTNRAINSTIKVIAGIAAHTLVCIAKNQSYPNEVFLSMRPLTVSTTMWKTVKA